MGNQSVTVSEVSSIPSDAIDVNFPRDFPAFYKDYNSISALATGLNAFCRQSLTGNSPDNFKTTGFARFGGYSLVHTGGTISMAYGIILCFYLPVQDAYAFQLAYVDNNTHNGLYWRAKLVSDISTTELDWTGITWKKVTSV